MTILKRSKQKNASRISIFTLVFLFLLGACSQQLEQVDVNEKVSKPVSKSCTASDAGVGSNGSAGWGAHFKSWLNSNGYSDLAGIEGWGGKKYASDCDAYWEPVIFIHGNSDYAQSWSSVRSEFIAYDYYPVELYGIGWGLKGAMNAANNHHKAEYMQKIRRLIAAVKAYTGSAKVDVVTHSMGVTLGRKAIKGGNAYNTYDRSGSPVNLGSNINGSIDTFVGIAGANRGLNSCGWWDGGTAVWSNTCWANGLSIDNPFIDDLGYGGDEATYTYTIKSLIDEVVCIGSCDVWYTHSSRIDGQNGGTTYSYVPYGHYGVKNLTAEDQINMVLSHTY